METIEHIDLDFLKRIVDTIPTAFLICDQNRDIVASNGKANELFSLQVSGLNLFELFTTSENNKINKLFEELLKNRRGIKELLSIQLANNIPFKGEVTLSEVIQDTNQRFYIISFNKAFGNVEDNKPLFVNIRHDEVQKIVSNKRILQVIDEIRSSFPFTFLGKNKIQQEINKLDEIFWLKDANDVYSLVNKKFSETLGLRPNQLEGKLEKNFLPIYFLDFYRTLENYVKETLNCLVIEGIPFRGFSSWQNYQTIEIPLSDAENNVLAIIGIAQKKSSMGRISEQSQLDNTGSISLDKIPFAIGVFDSQEHIIAFSKPFNDIFPELVSDVTNFQDLFPEDYSLKINEFLHSEEKGISLHIEISFSNDETSVYSTDIQKILNSEGGLEQIYVSLAATKQYDNIEDLIKHKGKMFDTLIQFNPEPILIYEAENLRFLEVNEAALNLYGYKRDEFLQMDLTDLYSPEDIQSLLDSSPSRDNSPRFQGPFKQRKKDGSNILVRIAKTSFTYENKEAHFNIIRNVSDEAAKNIEFDIFKSAFDNTSDLLFVTDTTGFITSVNNAAVESLGYQRDKFVGASIVEFLSDEHRGDFNSGIYYSETSETKTLTVDFKTSAGGFVNAEVKGIPIFGGEGKPESFNIIVHPVLKPQEIIKEVPVEVIKEVIVEREVRGHSHDDSSSSKNELDAPQVGTIFHEILTPINVILGFIQEIKDSLDHPTGEQKEAIDYINQNRDNLLDIMNAISEYAQIKAAINELVPDEIKLVDLLEKIKTEDAEFFESIHREFAIGKVSQSLTFYSDNAKFKQLLSILIKICLRITDESQVYVSAQQHNELSFIISVRDNFSKLSERLNTNFDSFINKKNAVSPRDFHLSRYSFSALTSLLDVLKGKYEVITRSGKPYEIGFVFPINLFEERSSDITDIAFEEEIPEMEIQNTKPASFQFDEKSFPSIAADDEAEISVPKDFEFNASEPANEKSKLVLPEDSKKFEENFYKSAEQIQNDDASERLLESGHLGAKPGGLKTLELAKMNCLYIEDQVDSQILFKVQMKELQDIKFAVSFEEALPLLSMNKFDFIVMDINLQGEYNGLDALKMIHQMPEFQHIPVIAVTAYVLPGDKEKFIAAGFNEFISKPIFREKMIDALEKIFIA